MSADDRSLFADRTAPEVAAVLLMLNGCASVPMADPAQDAAAKKFNAEPAKAALYVYRDSVFFNCGPNMFVQVNGKLLGGIPCMTYRYAQLAPGDHRLTDASPQLLPDDHPLELARRKNITTLRFTASAGKVYYVLLPALGGLEIVDEKTGQAGVLGCKLAAPVE